MPYRAVGDRCAVDPMELPAPTDRSVDTLRSRGFLELEVDMVAIGRSLVGVANYRRGSRLWQAPRQFDCSSFTKYLYGLRGIWFPRRSIQQRDCGEAVQLSALQACDLVFCSGYIDYYDTDPSDGVGHVGLATGEGTILHAVNGQLGVVESVLADFLEKPEDYRGARRIIPDNERVKTFCAPTGREVEISEDLRWIVLQHPLH